MKLTLKLSNWQPYVKPEINHIYNLNNLKILFYGNNKLFYSNINNYIHYNKIKLKMISGGGIYSLENNKDENIDKIFNFYQVLNKITDPNKLLILKRVASENDIIEFSGDDNQSDGFGISNVIDDDYNIDKEFVEFGYGINTFMNEGFIKKDILYSKNLTYPEFYLLMQIYFGLYQEDELKIELEKNDKNGKYDNIKDLLDYSKYYVENKKYVEDYNIEVSKKQNKTGDCVNYRFINIEDKYTDEILAKKEVQEYLKLQLIRKDTTLAFGGLEIKKIYDKDWIEEKQREYINEINAEFGEEVIVEE